MLQITSRTDANKNKQQRYFLSLVIRHDLHLFKVTIHLSMCRLHSLSLYVICNMLYKSMYTFPRPCLLLVFIVIFLMPSQKQKHVIIRSIGIVSVLFWTVFPMVRKTTINVPLKIQSSKRNHFIRVILTYIYYLVIPFISMSTFKASIPFINEDFFCSSSPIFLT